MSLLLAAALSALTVTGARIVDFGVYETIRTSDQEAPDTAEGAVHVLHPRLDPVLRKKTARIPARIGVRFGFRFQLDGEPHLAEAPVKVRILHPEFTNPETGKSSAKEEWDAVVNVGLPRFTGWAFDHPYELAPGKWTIQILREDRIVLQKEFVVVNP